jgi:hypothetical protein
MLENVHTNLLFPKAATTIRSGCSNHKRSEQQGHRRKTTGSGNTALDNASIK